MLSACEEEARRGVCQSSSRGALRFFAGLVIRIGRDLHEAESKRASESGGGCCSGCQSRITVVLKPHLNLGLNSKPLEKPAACITSLSVASLSHRTTLADARQNVGAADTRLNNFLRVHRETETCERPGLASPHLKKREPNRQSEQTLHQIVLYIWQPSSACHPT